jgi:hypothetical protein
MPTSKEIEIVIQAQLEQGNTIENAKNLGQGISAAIESAFDGLGERIASKLVLQMQGVLSNVKFGNVFSGDHQTTSQLRYDSLSQGMLGQPTQMTPGGIHVFNGTDARLPQAPGGTMPGAPIPAAPASGSGMSGPVGRSSAPAATPQSGFSDYFMRGNFGLGYLERSEFMGVRGSLGGELKSIQLGELDRTREDLRNYNRLKKINPDEKMDEDLANRIKSGITSAKDIVREESKEIGRLNKEIPELTTVIKELSKSFRDYEKALESEKDPQKRAELQNKKIVVEESYTDPVSGRSQTRQVEKTAEEVSQIIKQKEVEKQAKVTEVEQRNAGAASATDFVQKGGQALSEEARTGFIGRGQRLANVAMVAGYGLKAAGDVVKAVGRKDMYYARQAAAEHELKNNNYTNLLTGNLDDAFATELLGGQDQLISQSKSDARWDATGNVLKSAGNTAIGIGGSVLGAGIMGVGAALSTTGLGAILGVPAMAAGGAVLAHSAYNTFNDLGSVASGVMDVINPEQAAMRNQQQYIQLTKEQNRIAFMAADASRSRAIGSYTTAQSMGDAFMSEDVYGASNDPRSRNFGVNSSRYKAIGFGLSGQQFDAYNQQILSSMGGGNPLSNREDERYALRNTDVKASFDRGMQLYGQGFQSLPGLASALYNSNVNGTSADAALDRKVALDQAKDVFLDASKAGVNTMTISELGAELTQRIQSSAFGADDFEQRNFQRGIAGAQMAYGAGISSGPNVNAFMLTQNRLMDASRGSDGLNIVAGVNRIKKLNEDKDLQEEYIDEKTGEKKKRSLRLDDADEISLRKHKHTAKSYAEFYNSNDNRGNITEETAAAILKKNEAETIPSMMNTREWMGGKKDPRLALLDIADRTGATTGAEVMQIKTNIDVAKAQQEGRRIGPYDAKYLDPSVPLPMGTGKDGLPQQLSDALAGRGEKPIGQEAKEQKEKGEAELVTKGFGALAAQTDALKTKFGEVAEAMDKLVKLQNAPSNSGFKGAIFGSTTDYEDLNNKKGPASPATPGGGGGANGSW